MIDYNAFYDHISKTRLRVWGDDFKSAIDRVLTPGVHGDLDRWLAVLDELPRIGASSTDLASSVVTIGDASSCDEQTRKAIELSLKKLHPWRKGPFSVHGVYVDTEWRSDWKWQRLVPHLTPLLDKTVLDIGCGSGYHLWRMRGEGARLAIGVDPSLLFLVQFMAIEHFAGKQPIYLLPIGVEQLPSDMMVFDTVFSMGVLYHRRSPMDHLCDLRGMLRPGGELVLETLVIEGGQGDVLVPEGRYGRMGNVWFLPSALTLESWLRKCRFKNVRVVDVSRTTTEEQRPTEWMTFQSLPHFLHPDDPSKTIEGYSAPMRAIVIAEAP